MANKIEVYTTTKDLLLAAPVPQDTRTYKAVSHGQLIDLTLNSIEKAGFTLDKEIYSSSKGGSVANGRFSISNVADKEMQLQIGWQNSYDKTLTLKFAMGTRIFICQNGCVSGDMGAFKKKHQGIIQDFTPGAISEYIKQAGDSFINMQKEREEMKQIEITKRIKAELIGRMMIEESFITSTQMNIIMRELDAPTHDYNAKDSLWELYNYTTFAMKESHPTLWMDTHMKAHSFFVNESGSIISPTKEYEFEPTEMFKQLELDWNNAQILS
jgi:hypothetical protein